MSFFNLPPEIRIEIYEMIIADIPCTQDVNHPVGEFNLCQPALAKVNRMFRREVLHMWYNKKSFGICLYPRRHSEVDQVWRNFVDRFKAHTAGADGSHHLSRIQRLQVELWHPAYGPDFDRYRIYRERGVFPLNMCNGVYIQFGALAGQFGAHAKPFRLRIDHSKTDWTDRRAVRALMMVSIVETRRERDLTIVWRFFKTYPFERLVDLVMMIAAECKEAARVLHIATSFAPLQPWY